MCFNSSDDNLLDGTLPLSLFELPKLSVLSLGKLWRKGKHKNERSCYFLLTKFASCLYTTGLNYLEGTLPSEIGNAKALKVLDLRELIPSLLITSSASINFFVHFLFFAQIDGRNGWWGDGTNQFMGQIPSEIGAASNLELVNFSKLHLK